MQVQGVASKIVLKISIKTHVYSRKAGPHAGALSTELYIYIYNNINEDIDRIDVLYAYFDIYIYIKIIERIFLRSGI